MFRLLAPLLSLLLPTELSAQTELGRGVAEGESSDPVRPDELGFVGKIACGTDFGKIVSTAILVNDRRTLLTVAHFNFDDLSGRVIPVEDCLFHWSDRSGNMRFTSKFKVFSLGGNHAVYSLTRAADWALVQLETQAPFTAQPIRVGGPAESNGGIEVGFVGYTSRYQRVGSPIWQTDCHVAPVEHKRMLVLHRCKTAPGSSGGALVAKVDGRYRLIAIHTGRTSESGIAVRIEGALARSIALVARGEVGS